MSDMVFSIRPGVTPELDMIGAIYGQQGWSLHPAGEPLERCGYYTLRSPKGEAIYRFRPTEVVVS